MTLLARKVLEDCKIALAMMESEQSADRLRVLWIGGLAVLRMVGHVLAKVDGERDDISRRLKEIWPRFSAEKIFKDFIETSRNRALKEYEFDIYNTSSIVVLFRDNDGQEVPNLLPDCQFMPLLDGFRAGEDARDVFHEAIGWWDDVLKQVESA